MAIFEKKYTRESTILVQEIWMQTAMIDLPERFGGEMPRPALAIDFAEGMMTIWMNVDLHKYYTDRAALVLGRDIHVLSGLIDEYRALLVNLQNIWKKPAATEHELREVLEQMRQALALWHAIFYVAGGENISLDVKGLAMDLRKTDTFFMDADVYIRESLTNLLPENPGLLWFVRLIDLEQGINLNELRSRKAKYCFVDGESVGAISFKEYLVDHPEILYIDDAVHFSDVKEFRGQIAHKGFVKGKVKIVRTTQDASQVIEGDIIVSPMTVPDFLLAMKRAAAFITDEGGITCHAAIVSRELGKPCIIGTKIATKVLKDGDFVEVDAEKGIVRIIEGAK